MSHTDRSERPISRWISWVRPDCLPLAASRVIRSGDAPGNMEYSAVTQPLPRPRIQRGTSSSTDAVHSTRVALRQPCRTQRARARHDVVPRRRGDALIVYVVESSGALRLSDASAAVLGITLPRPAAVSPAVSYATLGAGAISLS